MCFLGIPYDSEQMAGSSSERQLHCHMATWFCIYLKRVRPLCPVQGSMLSVFCRGAEDRADDEQAVAQETGPKPVLPVEKMLSKKVGPIPLVSKLSNQTLPVPKPAPDEHFLYQAVIVLYNPGTATGYGIDLRSEPFRIVSTSSGPASSRMSCTRRFCNAAGAVS